MNAIHTNGHEKERINTIVRFRDFRVHTKKNGVKEEGAVCWGRDMLKEKNYIRISLNYKKICLKNVK